MEISIHNKTAVINNGFYVRIGAAGIDNFTLLQQQLSKKKNQLIIKRLFDVIVATLLIILLLLPMLIIVVAIKLTSKGPAVFSNERIGLNGKIFRCYKFRSMIFSALQYHEDHNKALQHQGFGFLHKRKHDTRITRIGRILRKTSLDELPQLFNVLKGDMSIVGPRPLVPFMLKPFPEFSKVRCLVKPGITGLWQIRDRANNTSAKYMQPHDLEYIENFSFVMDVRVLFITPIVVISAKGAY